LKKHLKRKGNTQQASKYGRGYDDDLLKNDLGLERRCLGEVTPTETSVVGELSTVSRAPVSDSCADGGRGSPAGRGGLGSGRLPFLVDDMAVVSAASVSAAAVALSGVPFSAASRCSYSYRSPFTASCSVSYRCCASSARSFSFASSRSISRNRTASAEDDALARFSRAASFRAA
jgi:hypothetical protein